MSIFTLSNIEALCKELHPDVYFHPTTLGYIDYLLIPYRNALNANIENYAYWIESTFPEYFGQFLLKKVNDRLSSTGYQGEGIEETKFNILRYIAQEIIDLTGNLGRDEYKGTVIPWDINKVISHDPEMILMFKIEYNLTSEIINAGTENEFIRQDKIMINYHWKLLVVSFCFRLLLMLILIL